MPNWHFFDYRFNSHSYRLFFLFNISVAMKDAVKVHWLPCTVGYAGSANVGAYFLPKHTGVWAAHDLSGAEGPFESCSPARKSAGHHGLLPSCRFAI